MEWKEALKLNMQAIDDIVKKYEEDDTIICVTSGVNISAFICYFYKIEPNNNIPYTQACGISPVIFNYKKQKINFIVLVTKEVSSYTYEGDKISLEEFLKKVSFNVDNYSKLCKKFKTGDLYLEIQMSNDKKKI